MDAITASPGHYRPLSHKYDTIDRRYKFFKASSADCMQMYYPLTNDMTGKYVYRKVYSSRKRGDDDIQHQIVKRTSSETGMDCSEFKMDAALDPETLTTINSLPDDVLLMIFAYCHPIDLINCFSLVSCRWNNLANHASLFTEVRVLVNEHSLASDSVRHFFERTSQNLRKLCVNCTVALPSAEVNALFDNICMPNVIYLDISTFDEMNVVLLQKLSRCFPNIETLHMEGIKRCSNSFRCSKKLWNQLLAMLFEDENTFPKIQNIFVGSLVEHCQEAGAKLLSWNRPLKVLNIRDEASKIDFYGITTSAWKSTLTELHLGFFINNQDFRYFSLLHNLKVFSVVLCLYTFDEEILPLKKLCNVEEFRLGCGDQDCNLSPDGMIALFTLPEKEPEKSFPYKLKYLALTELQMCDEEVIRTIAQNCPNLRALNFERNQFMGENAMEFIVKNFNQLIFLDLSDIGEFYKDDVWNNLDNEDLPNLRFLKVHKNQYAIENLQRLNLKRPWLLISSSTNFFINWTETENGYVFQETFDGDINAVMNDLCQIEGFSCCGLMTYFPPRFIYDDVRPRYMVRSSSLDTSGCFYPRIESTGISAGDHSV